MNITSSCTKDDLTEADYRALEARWITRELADSAGIFRVNSVEGGQLIGRGGSDDYSGLAIPFAWPGESPRAIQLRLDHPQLEAKKDGTTKPKAKYLFAPGQRNLLYIPMDVSAEMLANTELPIVTTEGAFKTLALWRLATENQEQPRFLPVGLSGVWGWRGSVGREAGPDGSRQSVKGPISDLSRMPLQGRMVHILFDSDSARNKSIQAAARGLAGELKSRGAIVHICEIPDLAGLDKTGADDFLAHSDGASERMLQLISAAREYEPDMLRYALHDSGNSERLMAHLKHVILYCYSARKWLYFTGTHWLWDTNGYMQRHAKLVMNEYYRQALVAQNEAHENFARRSLDAKRLENALTLARCEITVLIQELDSDPYLLNVLNGTVDLRSGSLRPHKASDYITRRIEYPYNPQAKCPQFLIFLNRIMGIEKSEERASQFVKFIQTAIGYSLVGVTTEKTVFLCHGSGDNGKTTLLEIIREIISAYSSTINIESLMSKNLSNNEAADLANLRGARFVRSSETEQGQRLNEARLKRITQGAGIIRACKKYEDWFEFPESHTLWVDANHKPVVRGQDPAIWNRLTLIPFEVSIPKSEQDPKLREKLLNEAEGILAWAIAGAVRWNNEGLQRPTEVLDAMAEWRATSDPINDFISDCCEISPDTWTATGILWDAYSKWTEESGIDPLSRNIFSVRIGGLGYTHGRRKSAGKIYRTVEGLRVRGT